MRILFYSHDRGGGNLLFRVAKDLTRKGVACLFLSHGPSENILNDSHVNGEHLPALSIERNLRTYVRKFRPTIVVTGTSIFSYGEHKLWEIARSLNIPSLALVDGWTKIRERFQSRNRKLITPDRFGVVDSHTKRLLARTCNINPSRIGIIGHPHLEEMSTNLIQARRTRTQSSALTVGFFSTPIVNTEAEPGIKVAQELLTSLRPHCPIEIWLKPHPREEINQWQEWIKKFQVNQSLINIKMSLVDKQSAFDILSNIDIAIGLPTSVMLESAFSRIPTIVIEPTWWPSKNLAISRYLRENILQDVSKVPSRISALTDNDSLFSTTASTKVFENSSHRAIRIIQVSETRPPLRRR